MKNTKKYLDVNSFLNLIETKNEYLQGHLVRVCNLAAKLAEIMCFSIKEIEVIKYGAILHDIGKIKIENSILNKNSSLNNKEFDIIKKHPIYGFKILEGYIDNKEILNVIKFHHERWDGNGYPFKLKGNKIPLTARIISVIDAFDAMTSLRPYRSKPLTIGEAIKELKDNAGTQFDEEIVREFCNNANEVMNGDKGEQITFPGSLLYELEKLSG